MTTPSTADLEKIAYTAALERGRKIKLGPFAEAACARLYPLIVEKEKKLMNEIWNLMTPAEQAEVQFILDEKHDAALETCTSMIAQLTYELNAIDTEVQRIRQRGGSEYEALINRRDSALGDLNVLHSLLEKLRKAL